MPTRRQFLAAVGAGALAAIVPKAWGQRNKFPSWDNPPELPDDERLELMIREMQKLYMDSHAYPCSGNYRQLMGDIKVYYSPPELRQNGWIRDDDLVTCVLGELRREAQRYNTPFTECPIAMDVVVDYMNGTGFYGRDLVQLVARWRLSERYRNPGRCEFCMARTPTPSGKVDILTDDVFAKARDLGRTTYPVGIDYWMKLPC